MSEITMKQPDLSSAKGTRRLCSIGILLGLQPILFLPPWAKWIGCAIIAVSIGYFVIQAHRQKCYGYMTLMIIAVLLFIAITATLSYAWGLGYH